MVKRKAKNIFEKWDKERLIDTLRKHGKLTYNDLYGKSGLTGKGTFNDRLKKLEQEGDVKREYEPSEEGRGKVLIKLTEKVLDPVEATLRRLELIGDPYSQFDVEKGRELLSENVVEKIMEVSTLCYGPRIGRKEKKFVCSIGYQRERWGRLPEGLRKLHNPPTFNEYHLIRAIARYDFETRGIKLYIEASPLSFGYIAPLISFDYPERLRKLQEALKREKDNPRLYPTKGIVSKENVREEFEELRLWIRPLLESARETQPRKEVEEEGIEVEGGESARAEVEKALKEWSDMIILERDKLLGGFFWWEQEAHLDRDLIPAWTDYMMELRS